MSTFVTRRAAFGIASNAVKAAVDDEKHGAQRFSHDYDMAGVLNGDAGAAAA